MTSPNSTAPPGFTFSRSQLFSAYNKARQAALAGKLEPRRVNRALGILQSKGGQDRLRKYEASTRACWCVDHRRGHICKHTIARMMERRATEQQKGGAK